MAKTEHSHPFGTVQSPHFWVVNRLESGLITEHIRSTMPKSPKTLEKNGALPFTSCESGVLNTAIASETEHFRSLSAVFHKKCGKMILPIAVLFKSCIFTDVNGDLYKRSFILWSSTIEKTRFVSFGRARNWLSGALAPYSKHTNWRSSERRVMLASTVLNWRQTECRVMFASTMPRCEGRRRSQPWRKKRT